MHSHGEMSGSRGEIAQRNSEIQGGILQWGHRQVSCIRGILNCRTEFCGRSLANSDAPVEFRVRGQSKRVAPAEFCVRGRSNCVAPEEFSVAPAEFSDARAEISGESVEF